MDTNGEMNIELLNTDEDTNCDEIIDDNQLMIYDIAVFYNTYNLSTLIKWWGTKLIIPPFQRAYVWTIKKASEFVDSLLRGLPVPSLFFYDDKDNKRLLVVDGQQRLNSLHSFIKEQTYLGKPFRLTGNIHPKWNGKTYEELEEEDRERLDDVLMNVTVMRQLEPDEGHSSMYLAFQRINTGGVSLNAQEIRMAVSYGPFAEFLDELSKDPRFDKLSFIRTSRDRMNDNRSDIQELILKFWTFYFTYPNFSGSTTRAMLDDFFDTQKNFEHPKRVIQGKIYHSRIELETAFNATFDIISNLPTECLAPFSKPTKSFLEAIWVGLTYRKLNLEMPINEDKLPAYINNWKKTITDEKFSELFQARRTSSASSAFERIKAAIEYFSGEF